MMVSLLSSRGSFDGAEVIGAVLTVLHDLGVNATFHRESLALLPGLMIQVPSGRMVLRM